MWKREKPEEPRGSVSSSQPTYTHKQRNLCIHTHWLNNIVFICVLVRNSPYEFVNDRQRQKTLMIYLKKLQIYIYLIFYLIDIVFFSTAVKQI